MEPAVSGAGQLKRTLAIVPYFSTSRAARGLALALAATLSVAVSTRANAEAQLLIEVDTGKVLHAENATYPWYPASVTKLMTAYATLRALKERRITLDTLIPISKNAVAQQPTKMGFQVGAQVTIDNALKMLMVKSANDIAVALAEGIGGSIDKFSDIMNNHARRLGMSQTRYVNPNGLPAENQVTSARDLAILARALIREFPEYDSYWHISAIRYGKKVMRNYNTLIDRYPGADGMKTGFICASGYNVVASATRNGKRLVVVVLGAYGGGVRAQKAAQLLERGFSAGNLSWLTPSLGTVDALAPINAQPPNLREEICGKHRRKPAAEDNEEEDETVANTNTGAESGDGNDTQQALMLSALRPQNGQYVLGGLVETAPPIEVYLGPARKPGEPKVAGEPKSKAAGKTAAAKPGQIAAPAPAASTTATTGQWNSLAPAALVNSPPANFAADAPANVPMPRPKPKQQSAKQ